MGGQPPGASSSPGLCPGPLSAGSMGLCAPHHTSGFSSARVLGSSLLFFFGSSLLIEGPGETQVEKPRVGLASAPTNQGATGVPHRMGHSWVLLAQTLFVYGIVSTVSNFGDKNLPLTFLEESELILGRAGMGAEQGALQLAQTCPGGVLHPWAQPPPPGPCILPHPCSWTHASPSTPPGDAGHHEVHL